MPMPMLRKFQVGRAIFFIGVTLLKKLPAPFSHAAQMETDHSHPGAPDQAGFYVFPLMANFGQTADVELWTVILSYFLGPPQGSEATFGMPSSGLWEIPDAGILSLLSGSFLLIFEGVLSVCLGCDPIRQWPGPSLDASALRYTRQAMYDRVPQAVP